MRRKRGKENRHKNKGQNVLRERREKGRDMIEEVEWNLPHDDILDTSLNTEYTISRI